MGMSEPRLLCDIHIIAKAIKQVDHMHISITKYYNYNFSSLSSQMGIELLVFMFSQTTVNVNEAKFDKVNQVVNFSSNPRQKTHLFCQLLFPSNSPGQAK